MKKSIKAIQTMAMSKERRLGFRETDVVIIDEISMLESNQFRLLDRACRAHGVAMSPSVASKRSSLEISTSCVDSFQNCFDCGVELKTRAGCLNCEPCVREDIYQPGDCILWVPSLDPENATPKYFDVLTRDDSEKNQSQKIYTPWLRFTRHCHLFFEFRNVRAAWLMRHVRARVSKTNRTCRQLLA
jgi:hypothetical protein